MRVISGKEVWRAKAETGFPLDMAIELCAQKDCVPAWDELADAALADGCNVAKLFRDLRFYVREAYTADVAADINQRMSLLETRYA